MVEEVEDQDETNSEIKKKYTYEWRNKWITSNAESIDDFIETYEHLAAKLRRWKEKGIELDSDIIGGVGDDYAQFRTYDEIVAFNEGFEEETFEEEIESIDDRVFRDWDDSLNSQDLSFIINEYLTVKKIDDMILIYVNGRPFKHCKFLFINDPLRNEQQEEVGSIDEAGLLYGNDLEREVLPEDIGLTKEQEFWGHCSNLQAWAENNYDSRLLHSNLAFPLLKGLTKAGDIKAKRIFKDEIGMRFVSGFLPVMRYLFREKFVDYLTLEEFSVILEELDYSKLDMNEVLEDIYDYHPSKYGFLFLSRIRKEFSSTIGSDRLYVEAVSHYLDASQLCPIVITPDCQHFIRGSNDGKLKEFDVFSGDLLRVFGHHPLYVKVLAISRDGKYVASFSDSVVNVWDYKTGELYYSFKEHNDNISSLTFDPGGYLLGGTSNTHHIKIWDIRKKKLHATLDSHWGRINSLSFSPDGTYMVSASNDKTVNVWDSESGRLITTLIGHKKGVTKAVITDNKTVVTTSFDDTIKIWNLQQSNEPVKEIDISRFKNDKRKYHTVSCQLTPDQRFIVVGLQDPSAKDKSYLTVWRLSDGKLIQSLPLLQEYEESSDPLLHLAVSPHGFFIIGAFQPKRVKIWMEFTEFMDSIDGEEV